MSDRNGEESVAHTEAIAVHDVVHPAKLIHNATRLVQIVLTENVNTTDSFSLSIRRHEHKVDNAVHETIHELRLHLIDASQDENQDTMTIHAIRNASVPSRILMKELW